MSPAPLPPAEYYTTLPRHIAGAGAILHDPAGRILLVRPSYRDDTWEIPGGGLDAGEDPLQAVVREVKEELGRDCVPGRLLVIDWVPEQPDGRPPLANYLFDGGPITREEASTQLCPDPGEVTDWHLAAPAEWDILLAGHMARACTPAPALLPRAAPSTCNTASTPPPTRPDASSLPAPGRKEMPAAVSAAWRRSHEPCPSNSAGSPARSPGQEHVPQNGANAVSRAGTRGWRCRYAGAPIKVATSCAQPQARLTPAPPWP